MIYKSLFFALSLLLSAGVLAQQHLKLATTTSTENSGLLTVLNDAFQQQENVKVDVVAVGTGKALKIGSQGDVDLVLVHAPEAEMKYVKQGAFIDRSPVMHNDFVIIGPEADHAGLRRSETTEAALHRLMATESRFVSRGDDSGTHKKELSLWGEVKPSGRWYIQAGQGMGAVIKMADEMRAYTLTDRGTYIAFADKIELTIVHEDTPPLFNPYHVMAVNPDKHPHVQYDLVKCYIAFLTGEVGQRLIRDFRIKGHQLFHPDVIK